MKRILLHLALLLCVLGAQPAPVFAQARDFNGTTDEITVTAAAAINNVHTFTWCAWVAYDTLGESSLGRIMSKGQKLMDVGSTDSFRIFVNQNTSAASATAANGTLAAGTKYFLCATHDASLNPKLYKGTLSSPMAEVSYSAGPTQGSGGALDESGHNLTIGHAAVAFDGRISHVSIWDQVLSPTQMDQLRLQPYAPFWRFSVGGTVVNLKGYWPLTESAAATARDHSGNGNHGTVTGTTIAEGVPW